MRDALVADSFLILFIYRYESVILIFVCYSGFVSLFDSDWNALFGTGFVIFTGYLVYFIHLVSCNYCIAV